MVTGDGDVFWAVPIVGMEERTRAGDGRSVVEILSPGKGGIVSMVLGLSY